MAKRKEEQSKSEGALAVIDPPPSLLAANEPDDISSAFGSMVADKPRAESRGVPIIQIDHEEGIFRLSGNPVENLCGYPVHWFDSRAWWPKPPQKGEAAPPTCWSADMVRPHLTVIGHDRQSESCATCEKAQWGSSPSGSKGQACRTSTFLFLVNPAFGNPPIAALILPPSSIRPLMGGGRKPGYLQGAKYFRDPQTNLLARYHELVWTSFGLEPGGDKHYVLVPQALRVCPSTEEAKALATVRNKFMDLMDAMRGTQVVANPVEE